MRTKSKVLRRVGMIAVNAFMLVVLLMTTMPFFLMASFSVKGKEEIFTRHLTLLPKTWKWENYEKVFSMTPYFRWYANTALTAVVRTALSLFLCSLAGYGFAKYEFKGKRALFNFVMLSMMLPFQILMVPLFLMANTLGWMDSYAALIIPFAASAFGIFLMRQHMLDIPNELIDSARIDGASEFGIYWRVILPISKPALGVLAILFFNWNWNDFLWPSIVLRSDELLILNVGIDRVRGQYLNEYGQLLAAAFLAVLPVIIIFLIANRQFIRGMMAGAVRGV